MQKFAFEDPQAVADMNTANAAKRDASNALLMLALGAGGGGALMAALSEVTPLTRRMRDPFVHGEDRAPLQIPLTAPNKRKKGRYVMDLGPSLSPMDAYKTAGEKEDLLAATQMAMTRMPKPGQADGLFQSTPQDRGTLGMLQGDNAKNMMGVPWFGALAVPAAAAPLYAGYFGTRELFKKLRKREAVSDTELARREYEQALADSLDEPQAPLIRRKRKTPARAVAKVAAQADPLDRLISNFESINGRKPSFEEMYKLGRVGMTKEAVEPTALSWIDPFAWSSALAGKSNTAGMATLGALPMGLAATLGALSGYQFAGSVDKSRSEAEQARRRQISTRLADNPPLYAMPVYEENAREEEEEDEENRLISNKSIGKVMKRLG